MRAAGTMTGFAAGAQRVRAFGNQSRMIGGCEIAVDFVMALFAFLGADVFRSRNIWQHDYRTVHRVAGHHAQNGRGGRSEHDEPALARSQDLAQRAGFAVCHGGVWLSFGYAVRSSQPGASLLGVSSLVGFFVHPSLCCKEKVLGKEDIVDAKTSVIEHQVQIEACLLDVGRDQSLLGGVRPRSTRGQISRRCVFPSAGSIFYAQGCRSIVGGPAIE